MVNIYLDDLRLAPIHGSVLITVINLPHQFIKQVVKLQQKNNIKENDTYVATTIEFCEKNFKQ